MEHALEVQKREGGRIEDVLQRLGYISLEARLTMKAADFKMEAVQLGRVEIPEDIVESIPPLLARRYNLIPVRLDNEILVVAVSDPEQDLEPLSRVLNRELRAVLAEETAIRIAMKLHYDL